MTDERRALDRLQAENDRLRAELAREVALREAVFAHCGHSLAYFDPDLTFVATNALHDARTRMPAAAKVGRSYAEAFPGLAGAFEVPLREVLATGREHRYPPFCWSPDPDVAPRWFEGHFVPVTAADGRTLGVLSLGLDVSDRVAREQERAVLRGVLESATDATVVWRLLRDAAGEPVDAVCILANPAAERTHGLPVDQLVGSTMLGLGAPDGAQRRFRGYVAVVETGEPQESEVHDRRPGRPERWIAIKAVKVGDGFALTITDVTAARVAQQALAAERELLQLVLRHTPVAIAYLDQDLIYRLSNPAHEAFSGIPAAEGLGRRIDELHPHTKAWLVPIMRGVIDAGREYHAGSFPFAHRPEDPQRFYDITYAPAQGDDGRATGIIAISMDVTDRVARIQALERADRLKDEFLGMVSHELRTPLHILMAYLTVLRQRPADADALAKVEAQAAAVGAIVDAMLDFSQLRSGTLALVREAVAIAPYLAELCVPLADLAAARALSLALEIAPDLPPVWLDPRRVGQVVTNLVGNAIKFTAPGGAIRVSAAGADGALRVEVADTGVGIPPDQHERIFERFVQVDMSLTREVGGVGLGLAIAKELVEAHGGTIGLQSAPGAGSCFVFTIPYVAH